VLVEVIDKSTLTRIPGLQRNLSWTRLMGLNRVGESAGKVNKVIYISVSVCMLPLWHELWKVMDVTAATVCPK